MYQVGDYVVYGGSGVCQVDGVGAPSSSGCDSGRAYYTLHPLSGSETIYVPVDTHVSMRPVLTRQEADELICRLPSLPEYPVDREARNPQLLSHAYQASFRANSCTELARLLKTIHRKDADARRTGRQPGRMDERYRKRAEELLYRELSVALGIPRDGVPKYIRQRLQSGGPD